MGNALNAVGKAVDAKFIGGNPLESKFAAIDKGILGVKTWKDNIDAERLKLKTDTANQIREAEKYAYENMPQDETAKTRILADLAKYKDQMLMNERLVRNGAIKPEENLIFFENGKQTFEIYADMVNNFDAELQLTKKRAEGYYVTDEKTGKQTFVPPESGNLEAIKQEIQTQIGTLQGIETNFTEKGMGNVTFFQMEVDPITHTYQPKRDADGNKIPLENTQANMSVLALSHKANTRADRRYLINDVTAFSDQTALTYQTMFSQDGMIGNVVDDAKNNPQLDNLIKSKVAALTSNVEAVASYFTSENGFGGQLVSFTQWDNLTDKQKAETITVTLLDENLEEKEYTYKKYAKVAAANQNNAIVPEVDEDQIAATEAHVRTSLVSGLQKKISKGNTKPKFSPYSNPNYKKNIDEANQIILLDEVVRDGNQTSLTALVNSMPSVTDYKITDEGIVFTMSDGNLSSPIDISSGAAKDIGTLFASILGIDPNVYKSKSKVGDIRINTGVVDFEGYSGTQSVYRGIDEFVFGKKDGLVITSNDLLTNAEGKAPELEGAAQKILSQAQSEYGVDLSGFKMKFSQPYNGSSTLKIYEDGVLVKTLDGDRTGDGGFESGADEIGNLLNNYIKKKVSGEAPDPDPLNLK